MHLGVVVQYLSCWKGCACMVCMHVGRRVGMKTIEASKSSVLGILFPPIICVTLRVRRDPHRIPIHTIVHHSKHSTQYQRRVLLQNDSSYSCTLCGGGCCCCQCSVNKQLSEVLSCCYAIDFFPHPHSGEQLHAWLRTHAEGSTMLSHGSVCGSPLGQCVRM